VTVPFPEAVRVWARVAALSFGGPAAQIAVMQRILVDEKRWVGQRRFLHALNYCMLLPGPEAQQLATYIGWLLHGWRGGLVAGMLFVLPGFLAILLLSVVYVLFGDLPALEGLFLGLKAAVLAVVVQALIRIGRRALVDSLLLAIAAASFVAIFFFEAPFPFIVLSAAIVGSLGQRGRPIVDETVDDTPIGDRAALSTRPSWGRLARVVAVGLAVWALPFVLVGAFLGTDHVLFAEAAFFSKVAVVTFGGAYAVLAYVAQQAVEAYGWLGPREMLDGLGLAETTPGPLISVVSFVGFLGAFRDPGGLDPLTAGILGAVVTTWVTYAPSFLWIFAGAPYAEWVRSRRALSAALAGVTAAVVGVILNLAVWFSVHTLFGEVDEVRRGPIRILAPVLDTLDPLALALALGAAFLLFIFRIGMLPVLALVALAGLAIRLLMS
jgi:chromate transporter